MKNHNRRHAKGNDMDKACGAFKDDGVGELDIPGVAGGNDSSTPGNG